MLVVRNANFDDLASIHDLLLQVHAHHANLYPDLYKRGGVKYSTERVKELLFDLNTIILVAEADGLVVGSMFLKIIQKQESDTAYQRKILYVDDLSVDKAHRQLGVGTCLMQKAEELAKDICADDIELNCWSANVEALQFYEKLGYEPLTIKLKKDVK